MLPVKRLTVIGFELAVSKKSTGSAGKASRAGRPPGRDRRRAGPPPKSGARAGGLQPTGEFERGDRQNTPISLGRHRPSTSITAVLKSAKSPFFTHFILRRSGFLRRTFLRLQIQANTRLLFSRARTLSIPFLSALRRCPVTKCALSSPAATCGHRHHAITCPRAPQR